MTSQWIKTVEISEVVDGKLYFIGLKPITRLTPWEFSAETKSGKRIFSRKPGLALKYEGSQKFRDYLASRPDLCAVEIPPDSDKRWRARR